MEQPNKLDLYQHARENVLSGRSLDDYTRALGFNATELEGHRVLNFGCGGSNLGSDFELSGIECTVIDVDVLPNPHTVHDERLNSEERSRRRQLLSYKIADAEDGQPTLPAVEEHENALLGIEGRTFIQITPSEPLPFPDGHFDDVLVLWVYHQLPPDARMYNLSELIRVSKSVRIAPIGRRELAEINDFVTDHPDVRLSTTDLKTGQAIEPSTGYFGELDIDRTSYPHDVAARNPVRVVLERV